MQRKAFCNNNNKLFITEEVLFNFSHALEDASVLLVGIHSGLAASLRMVIHNSPTARKIFHKTLLEKSFVKSRSKGTFLIC